MGCVCVCAHMWMCLHTLAAGAVRGGDTHGFLYEPSPALRLCHQLHYVNQQYGQAQDTPERKRARVCVPEWCICGSQADRYSIIDVYNIQHQ